MNAWVQWLMPDPKLPGQPETGTTSKTVESPVAARGDSRFSGYFHALCAELDIQTEKTA